MKKGIEMKNKIKGTVKTIDKKRIITFVATLTIVMTIPVICFAAGPGTEVLDEFESWLFEWIKKIGYFVMAFGGIRLALGFHRQDSEEKIQGLTTLMAGGMVTAIGFTPSIFGL